MYDNIQFETGGIGGSGFKWDTRCT